MGLIDALDAFGFIDRRDFDPFMRSTVSGESVEVAFTGLDPQAANANLQMAEYIDEGHDVYVTTTATAAQLAVNVSIDLDEPPIVLFVGIDDPYAAGPWRRPAASSCQMSAARGRSCPMPT